MREAENAFSGDLQRWVEALTWYETLTEAEQSQLTTALIRDWQAWHADPENQRIFGHLSQLAADARRIRKRSQSWKMDVAEQSYDPAFPITLWKRANTSGLVDRRLSWAGWQPWLSGVVAVAAAAAIAVLVLWLPLRWAGARQGSGVSAFETATGGLENVHLGDGSQITLGGRTKLLVDLSARARSVELIQGQAWFKVAHDARWPFVVHAGDGAITAVGTAFLVTRDSDRVVVTVTEGTVAVISPPLVRLSPTFGRNAGLLSLPPPIRVSSGEEVSYRDNGTIASVVSASARTATAWTHGRLIFDDEPLKYVVESVNRYFPRRISATPAVGRLRFSGVIFGDGIEDWLHDLSDILPVEVDERNSDICVRVRAARTDSFCSAMR